MLKPPKLSQRLVNFEICLLVAAIDPKLKKRLLVVQDRLLLEFNG